MFPSPRAEARARRGAELRRRPRPVFVDDSGRRRRVARAVGITSGAVALAYVVFVGLTFAGAPGLGKLDAAGLGQLTNPAGERADLGSNPREQAVPAAVAGGVGVGIQAAGPGPGETSPATSTPAPVSAATVPATTTTTASPATTTTTRPGHGTNTSAPTPNSTVPGKGPPTSRPGGR